ASPAATGSPVEECLRDAGFEMPRRVRCRTIRRGVLADTLLVTGLPGLDDAVLKIHWFDLGQAMRADPDPRFGTIRRALPVPPYFASARERLEHARRALPVPVPEILAEGRLPGGVGYTLMSRLEGEPWEPHGRPARALSREAGSIVAALHAGTAGASTTA